VYFRSILVPFVPGIADQISNALGSGGAIGIGIGGLVVVGALLLLLFLMKRKKGLNVHEPEETGDESMVDTITDNDNYISEYGLSEGVRPMEDEDGGEDLPQVAGDGDQYVSDIENASEHNPEDLEGGGFSCDPGEV
jgi:hypothetical protein